LIAVGRKLYSFTFCDEVVKAVDEVAEKLKITRTASFELLSSLGYAALKELLEGGEKGGSAESA
jgi:hypothetical protein